MAGTFHVHDLLLLKEESSVTFPAGGPTCPDLTLNGHPWVVVRRGHLSSGSIPVGVRGLQRHERYGGFTESHEVLETRRPDQLRLALAGDSRRALRAFRTLLYIESHLEGLDMSWGPGGSVGYELASGLPAAHADSDLDLILFSPRKLEIAAAQDLWRMFNDAPGKVDALVETPCCGFSLEEYATTSLRKLLLRTSHGRLLGSDPWDLSNHEDN
jgi:phosphoribosyl-dephospho-CoA transferase